MSTWTKTILDESRKTGLADIIIVDTAVRWRTVWQNSFIIRFFGGSFQAIKNILSTFFTILARSPHVLHICSTAGAGSLRDIILIRIALTMRIPAIIHYHTGRLVYDIEENGLKWKLTHKAMKLAKTIAVFTKTELDLITKIIPEKNVIIVPNMIDLTEIDKLIKSEL